jgi:hypothetical protein
MTLCEQLAELRRNPRAVSPRELHELLAAAGFERLRKVGATWVYTHADVEPFTVRDTDPLMPSYVTFAVGVMEQVVEC